MSDDLNNLTSRIDSLKNSYDVDRLKKDFHQNEIADLRASLENLEAELAQRELKAKNILESAQQRVCQVEQEMETMKNWVNNNVGPIQSNIVAPDNTPQIRGEAPEEPKTPKPEQISAP